MSQTSQFSAGPSNLSMPEATVIPLLSYPDVSAAAAWLCHVFGFSERLRIGIQLSVGQGSIVVADLAGRAWTFSQSEANVDPADWAGILGSGAET